MEANQPFQQENLIITPPFVAAPKSEDVYQPVSPDQVLPSSNTHALSYKSTQTSLRRGNIHPTVFRNSRPKFDMEANLPFQQDNLIITPPCVAAPKSDRRCASTS